jgi:hypothetical protein
MPRRTYAALLAWLCVLAAPLWALPEPGPDELKANRARLEQWRKHPDQLARLRRDLQAFEQLPEERRQKIAQLDHDLHEEPSASQARLWNVLERYADWLERLPDKDRLAVKNAPDKAARIGVIRDLRDRDWIQAQPKAVREKWAELRGEARAEFLKKLREEERQRRQEWQIATRFWRELETKQPMPVRLSDIDARDKETSSIQMLVNEYLMPILSQAEKDRLKKAEGQWPAYPQTLVEIADRHPFALPGPEGPRHLHELPLPIQNRLKGNKAKDPKFLRAAEGRWPDFAVAVAEHVRKMPNYHLPNELWASSYQSLLTPMREYVDKTLRPVLTSDEKLDLIRAEGKWPDYPKLIQQLATDHHLAPPPWQTAVPGPRERWDGYRALKTADLLGLPELSRRELRDFALYELDAQERAGLNLSPDDPGSWLRLRESYFQRKRDELLKHRRLDQGKVRAHPSLTTVRPTPAPKSGT